MTHPPAIMPGDRLLSCQHIKQKFPQRLCWGQLHGKRSWLFMCEPCLVASEGAAAVAGGVMVKMLTVDQKIELPTDLPVEEHEMEGILLS